MRQCDLSVVAWLIAGLASIAAGGGVAEARPGTHGPSISTWDTRSSSVVFSARETAQTGPVSRHLTYSSNFSSTTGRLSTQLGLHYAQYQEVGGTLGHGVSGGAITLYNIPLAGRLKNGLPFIGLGLYFGPAPAAVVGEEFGYVSLPVVAGAGLAISPLTWLTISPWFEGAMSLDIDTNVHYRDMDLQEELEGQIEDDAQEDIEAGQQPDLTADEVREVVDRAVDIDTAFGYSWRLGVSAAVHLGDWFDLSIEGGLGRLGISASEEDLAPFATAALVFRWDAVVPAVLPPPPPPECPRPPLAETLDEPAPPEEKPAEPAPPEEKPAEPAPAEEKPAEPAPPEEKP